MSGALKLGICDRGATSPGGMPRREGMTLISDELQLERCSARLDEGASAQLGEGFV